MGQGGGAAIWIKWPKTAWQLQNQHFWGKTVVEPWCRKQFFCFISVCHLLVNDKGRGGLGKKITKCDFSYRWGLFMPLFPSVCLPFIYPSVCLYVHLSCTISQEPYIIWLQFLEQMCEMMIAPCFFFFSKFWFSGLLGGKKAKNNPKWQKILSVKLHISGIIHHMTVTCGTLG